MFEQSSQYISVVNSSLKDHFDVVVVLSQSNWYREMRSNRYHYATRFSHLLPVYFVQNYDPNQKNLIAGEEGNITIVNPIFGYGIESIETILEHLRKKKKRRILFWIYCPSYVQALKNITLPHTCIYHATEAYIGSDMINSHINLDYEHYIGDLKDTINSCSVTIAVSQGVANGIQDSTDIIASVHTVTNGCDFPFWNGFEINKEKRENSVIYQGGIHSKLDFDLLTYLIEQNPNVTFWFCGSTSFSSQADQNKWDRITKYQNVTYFGNLHVDRVRELCHKAKVGIIPFRKNDWLTKRAFPLKAFEYLSSGLEVVSTPIESIESHNEYFYFGEDYEKFNLLLQKGLASEFCHSLGKINLCKEQDYDAKFSQVLGIIEQCTKVKENLPSQSYKKKVLFLYDKSSCHVNTIREHVNAFGLFSKNEITFYNATSNNKISEIFLNSFEVVAIHYSVRVSVTDHLSPEIATKLAKCTCLKILFIQDEYDNLPSTYKYIKELGIDIIFTCVPERYHEYVYPKSLFPSIRLVNNLTGYVSYTLQNFPVKKIKDRKVDVFYRGRELPYYYGTLGREKFEISKKFEYKVAEDNIDLFLDLNSDNSSRIYGSAWYRAISSSKTMLGTESGSNLFDFNGNLRELMQSEIDAGHDYDYIFQKYIAEPERHIRMNQISPKLFEAISLKTVLILYEGEYSGLLQPYEHFIPLKKDFSNFQEVCSLIKDDVYLQRIADKAYTDIVCNHAYSYEHYIRTVFDKVIDEEAPIIKYKKISSIGDFSMNETVIHRLMTNRERWKLKNGYGLPSATSNEQEEFTSDSYLYWTPISEVKSVVKDAILSFLLSLPSKYSKYIFKMLKGKF